MNKLNAVLFKLQEGGNLQCQRIAFPSTGKPEMGMA